MGILRDCVSLGLWLLMSAAAVGIIAVTVEIQAGNSNCSDSITCVSNAICEDSICKIKAGNSNCSDSIPCVSNATCEDNICKIQAGNSNCSDSIPCVSNATCEDSICKIEAGCSNCSDSIPCVSNATCEDNICKIEAGNSNCSVSIPCVSNATCEDNICKIQAGNFGCTNSFPCVSNVTCEENICKIPAGQAGCSSIPCVSSTTCEDNTCKIPAGKAGCNKATLGNTIRKRAISKPGDASLIPCVFNTTCEENMCKISAGKTGCNNSIICVSIAICEDNICKLSERNTGCNDSIPCASNAICQENSCRIRVKRECTNRSESRYNMSQSKSCQSLDLCETNATCISTTEDNSCTQQCRWNYGQICNSSECQDINNENCSSLDTDPSRCLCLNDYFRNTSKCISASLLVANHMKRNDTTLEQTLSVAWNPPNILLSGDLEYKATIKSANATNHHQNWTEYSHNLSATFVKLTEGTKYDITVTTRRKKDPKFSNDTVEKTTAAVSFYTKPAIPGSLTKMNYNVTNINLEFNASAGNVEIYIVAIPKIGVTVSISGSVHEVNFTDHNLTPGRSYTVTIVAVSGEILSEQRSDNFSVNVEFAGQVSELEIADHGGRWARVTWQPPQDPNGDIMGYTVRALVGDHCVSAVIVNCSDCVYNEITLPNTGNCSSTTVVKNKADLNSNSTVYDVNVTSLQPDVKYTIFVDAFSQKGRGNSNEIKIKTEIEAALQLKLMQIATSEPSQLTVTWNPDERTGPTTYVVSWSEKESLDSSTFIHKGSINITGYNKTTYTIVGLLSYWEYEVSVLPFTIVTEPLAQPTTMRTRTVDTAPDSVQSVIITQPADLAQTLLLFVICPDEKKRNGPIESIDYNITADSGQINPSEGRIPVNSSHCSGSVNILVTAEKTYIFTVFARTANFSGNISISNKTVHPIPPKLQSTEVAMVTATSISSTSSVTIRVCQCAFSSLQGEIVLTGLIVCVKSPGEQCQPANRSTWSSFSYESLRTWKQFQKDGYTGRYRPTPETWKNAVYSDVSDRSHRSILHMYSRQVRDTVESDSFSQYTIGDNTSCSALQAEDIYCNGPLPEGTSFVVIFWACTRAGCSESPDVIVSRTRSKDTNSVGAIAGGVVAVLAVIAIIVTAVFFVRRKKSKRQNRNEEFSGAQINMPDVRWNISKITSGKAVKLKDFAAHADRLHKDANRLFQEEFEALKVASPKIFTNESALMDANKSKNRYVNILPYDHSRVKLIADEDDESKDYINANYIPGFSSSREYIATQGPLKDTIVDFWRMIWEQKSLQIVVLSGIQETGRPKVDLYWPEKLNSPVQYGDIIVKQTSNASLDKYNIRTFQIYKEYQPQETRRVQQYFINSWEDYPANLKSEDIIDLVSIVRRDARPAIHGPITVHCSAGVGWTGTFIALDVLMQFVEKHDLNGEVNVFNLVLGMRRNRCMMVQTEVQYVFIHDALKLMIENKIEKMNNEANPVYNNTIFNENVYVNEGCDVDDESLYKNVVNSNRVNTSL